MAIQIANPTVVDKIERLAQLTGLNKTAAVEIAVDRLLNESAGAATHLHAGRAMASLLAQLDRLPDLPTAFDPLQWDEFGLPR